MNGFWVFTFSAANSSNLFINWRKGVGVQGPRFITALVLYLEVLSKTDKLGIYGNH